MAKPVISYPGAKWRFYPYMKEYFPRDMRVLIEPFFGGGSVSLSVADDPDFTKLERIIVGDLAPEVWAHWVGVRDNADDVIEIVHRWWKEKCPLHYGGLYGELKSLAEGSEEYRKTFDSLVEEGRKFWEWSQDDFILEGMSIPERAARFYLVNQISFSGMGDSGSLSKQNFMEFHLGRTDRIKQAEPLLKKMEINNVSFEETMVRSEEDVEGSFIFLDPPYWKQEESGLYGKGGDTHKGFPHEKFCEFTKSMKCKWFVTYDDSVYVRKQFKGKDLYGNKIVIKSFVIPGGYTMALKNSEDALAGEEVFIANYKLDNKNDSVIGLI